MAGNICRSRLWLLPLCGCFKSLAKRGGPRPRLRDSPWRNCMLPSRFPQIVCGGPFCKNYTMQGWCNQLHWLCILLVRNKPFLINYQLFRSPTPPAEKRYLSQIDFSFSIIRILTKSPFVKSQNQLNLYFIKKHFSFNQLQPALRAKMK